MKSILFTSAGLGEGKSTFVTNLAITLAQEGQRVLLVDADLRRPIVHQRLGLDRIPGLADALVGSTSWRSHLRSATDLMLGPMGVDRVMSTPGLDNLHILTSGSAGGNPNEFLNMTKIKALVNEMNEEYDLVLFDTPPILPVTDAVAFSARVDGTIVVYQVGRIGRNAIGFGGGHTRAHVYRAILEGLAYALRDGADRTSKRSGAPITELRVAGGGSQSDQAMQITADVFGLTASRPHLYEASELGAAFDAAIGLKLHRDFDTAIKEMTRLGQTFEPNPQAHAIYDEIYRYVYGKMYGKLKPLYETLRRVSR